MNCVHQGVGKGHVLNWLSAEKLFPLEYVVHVDPDFFKSIMPEWTHYRDVDEEQAGSFCHAGETSRPSSTTFTAAPAAHVLKRSCWRVMIIA